MEQHRYTTSEKSKTFLEAKKAMEARYNNPCSNYTREDLIQELAWEHIRYNEVVKEANLLRRVAKQLKKVVRMLSIP